MINSIFILSLISHILGDFVFQSDTIAKGRLSLQYEGIIRIKRSCIFNVIHSLIHSLIFYILMLILNITSYVIVDKQFLLILTCFIFHFLIDISKPVLILLPKIIESLINKLFEKIHLGTFSIDTTEDRVNFIVFILDQIMHILALMLIFRVLYNYTLDDIYKLVLYIPYTSCIHEKILGIILILLISTFEAAYFSKFLLNSIKTLPCSTSNNEASRGGFLIGILERIFIILGIVLKHATAIALVLTLKSIARYKKFDNDSFSEYYIIGTFLSFVIAIIGGVCIASLL
ncbi:MAG: DUF3307 domain-containing protein [Clostridium sp.]|nr:DUF3307 domain-containing protein [Clostridium sp.]